MVRDVEYIGRACRFTAAEPQCDKRWRPAVEFLKEYHRER